MNAKKKFAPDVERLTTLIKNSSPLVNNHAAQNYLRILMYAMIRGDEYPAEFCTDEELADTAEIIRKHRTHVLSMGHNLGMSQLAQMLCHEQTAAWAVTGHTDLFQNLRRQAGPTSAAEERDVYAGVMAATMSDTFEGLIDAIRLGRCHSAVIVGCNNHASRAYNDKCLLALRQVMPAHGRIFIIG